MKQLWIIVLIVAFCRALLACNRPASGRPSEAEGGQEAVTGGTTDRTDPNAKKTIESRNLVEFFTSFYIYDKYESGNDGRLIICIRENDRGEQVLAVQGVYEHELVVGSEVLAEVQHIIEQYGLVKCNGINKVTAGLAPEYGPWELRALYDSGETLYFRENGAPDGDWTAALRDYFITVMADAGCTDVLPPKEALTIVHFSTAFEKDGNSHHYGTITFPAESGNEKDDVVLFRHTVVDLAQQKAIQKQYAELTEELFEGLQQVIEASHMDLLHAPQTVTFNLQRYPAGFLELYVDYENGRQIYCEYSAQELPEEWPAMRDALMEYLAAYLEQHPADPNRE